MQLLNYVPDEFLSSVQVQKTPWSTFLLYWIFCFISFSFAGIYLFILTDLHQKWLISVAVTDWCVRMKSQIMIYYLSHWSVSVPNMSVFYLRIHVHPFWEREQNRNVHHRFKAFSQLVQTPLIIRQTNPWCNETRGCHSNAVHPSRREALNEKVTSHPPVKEQMPHQSKTWHGRRYGYTAHARELTDTQVIQRTHVT